MASPNVWPTYGTMGKSEGDVEAGAYYQDEASLRWGFIRKVYGILTFQLAVTFAVGLTLTVSQPALFFVLRNAAVIVPVAALLPLILVCVLACYRQHYPINLVLITLFSLCFGVTMGLSCAVVAAHNIATVVAAVFITATVVAGLTLYTFWAERRGANFEFLGPALFVGVLVLLLLTTLALFIHLPFMNTAIAAGGALLFSLYIVYDTNNIIRHYSYDDYVWASLALYLDIINLFQFILELLSTDRSG